MHAKEPTKIKITSDNSQDEGGKLSINLADLSENPISKEIVNITIIITHYGNNCCYFI